MNKLTPLLICFTFTGTASASTIFSCDLSNKHNVSIDSSNQLGLAYDYGKVGATKSDLTLDNKSASFGDYMGPNWEYKYFRFARGDYSYVVYDRDGRTQGLAVYQGNKLLMNKKCTGNIEYEETDYAAASNQIKHDPDDNVLDFMPEDTSPPSDNSTSSQDQQQESQTQQTQQTQQLEQPPVKVQIQDIPHDFRGEISATHSVERHIYVYSLVDSIAINGVSIDRGSCYEWNIKPYVTTYGKRADFHVPITSAVAYANTGWNWITSNGKYSQCLWSEILVKTNKGDFKFDFNLNG